MRPGFSQFNSVGGYSASLNVSRQGLLTKGIAWRLVLLTALGPAFSNILIYRLGDFAVTPSHLLLIGAAVLIFRLKWKPKFGLIFPIVMMWVLDFYHALVVGYIGEIEWLKSFSQMLAYGACFVVIAGFLPNRLVLKKTAPWAMKLGILLGSISILQFALLLFGISAYIPEGWAVKSTDFAESVWRYGGFTPAIGLATEPSYYALGLVSLWAYLLFLYDNNLLLDKKLFWISFFVLCGGILVTFSLAGVTMTAIILLIWLGIQRKVRLVFWTLLTIATIGIVGANIGIISPIQARLQKVLLGADNSAQIRVTAALRLLFAMPTSFESFAFGTGLGMEEREFTTYLDIYREASLRSFVQDEVKIHNTLTTIRFFQGWLGVVVYGILLWNILLPKSGGQRTFSSVLVFFILYHFASGFYLSPSFWALVALIALMRRVQLEQKAPASVASTWNASR
jgi:hypothetical protein